MRISAKKSRNFINGLVLLLIFSQSLALHFHFGDGDSDSDHSHQVHTHSLELPHGDHMITDHDDESNTDLIGTSVKKSYSLDFLVLTLAILFTVVLPKSRAWQSRNLHSPPHYLLFFRPPLRAPPF